MPKIYEIRCEVCDEDITRGTRIETGTVNPSHPDLDRIAYFCSYKHMYQYLDSRRPDDWDKE